MKLRKNLKSVVLAACLLLFVFAASAGFCGGVPSLRLNPAFLEYMNRLESGEARPSGASGERGLGYIPPSVDLSHLKGASIIPDTQIFLLGYPATYDLRNFTDRLSPVKDQGFWGTCWAFAAYGSMESWLLYDEGSEYEFSVNHMVNMHGFDPLYNQGGNLVMATAYLARWDGPVLEEDDPYDPATTSRIGMSTGEEPVRRHVQQVLFIPGREGYLDNNNIKYAVQNYGAVYTSMHWNEDYYNPTTFGYDYYGMTGPNHAVAIVGWDDNFPAGNFGSLNPPPGDGAFIVRNSWGENFGDGGYFYISYYDTMTAMEINAVFNNAENLWNYGSVYEYDPFGLVAAISPAILAAEAEDELPDGFTLYEDRIRSANVFIAEGNEVIEAVGFYGINEGMDYWVYIYTGLGPGDDPHEGAGGLVAGRAPAELGYQTVVLDTPVLVSAGERFSVIVRFETTLPGDSPYVSLELPWPGHSSAATANPGESFVRISGYYDLFGIHVDFHIWEDITDHYPDTNVCIKAFTKAPEPEPMLEIEPEHLDFGFQEDQLSFLVSNSGTGPLNWSIDTGEIVYNEGDGWIAAVSPLFGTVGPQETDEVIVTLDRDALDFGTFTAVIKVASDGGSGEILIEAVRKSPPDKPENISPADGATNLSRTPELRGSDYYDPDGDPLYRAWWRIRPVGADAWWNSFGDTERFSVPSGVLDYSAEYEWQVRYENAEEMLSEWSDKTAFTTMAKPQRPPERPINISPPDMETGVSRTPTLSASAFYDPDGDTMADSNWRLRAETGGYQSAAVWEAESAGAVTSIVVTVTLSADTRYFWQVRYMDSDGMWSSWSQETSFLTEGASSGGEGGCFIATAAYGSPMAAEVESLREFRDTYLMTNRPGRAFVRWYYRHSPAAAGYIETRRMARAAVRAVLRPVLLISAGLP